MNSKLKYIEQLIVSKNSYEFTQGVIDIANKKKTITTSVVPEWLKNMILSYIVFDSKNKDKIIAIGQGFQNTILNKEDRSQRQSKAKERVAQLTTCS